MPLRQMGQAVDLRAAIPKLNERQGPNAYDAALRERLQAVSGIGNQQNNFSAQQAYKAQQDAFQQKMQGLQSKQQSLANTPMPEGGAVRRGDGKWISPVTGKVIFGFGQKYSASNAAVTGSSTHRGLDFGGAAGTPVYAPGAGKLIGAVGNNGWNSGRGNYLSTQFDDGGFYGLFEHLQSLAPGLKPGQAITPGMLLGYMGSTGNANGVNHLHFETRYNLNDGSTAFDPSSWFGW